MKNIVKWIKRILITLLGIILLVMIALWISFYFWKKNVIASLPNDTKVITTSNGQIEYVLEGNSKRVMLMIHGSPGSVHVSRFEASTFLDKGFSVLSVSRPGYYQTPLSSGTTVKEQAALYLSLLNELGIESVYVNGVSGGGPSSIQFAIDYPERCSGLILRATVSEKLVLPEDNKNLLFKFFETEFGTWLGIQITLSQSDEITKNKFEMFAKRGYLPFEKTAAGYENDIIQFTKMDDLKLENVISPTIIFHGNKDDNVPLAYAQNASKRIPEATFVEMNGKNHFVFLTSYADTINNAIVKFIDSPKE
jgi:2-hydroxy-6-oxonona-2,4-dienedioate hydrolase